MGFRLLLVLTFLSIPFPGLAAEVAGVKLPDEDQKLVLNGAGLRKRAFFQVYAIGLYLPEKKTGAAEAINAPGPKRVAMHMLRDVGADQFGGALTDGLKDNHSEAEMKALEPRIRQLLEAMAALKEAKEGMRITLDWVPGAGTQLAAQGKPVGAPIPGEDFYRALLRIWIGEHPVQSDLKKALLGG
ncbi:MAG: chalcone isomerase family protein [Burkholderiales bacterium]|nr:chalcone isomerase family protein [Burkholderiales bacterium]